MRITDVINRLTAYLRDHGDLEFVTMTDVDGSFCIERRPVDLIEILDNGPQLVAAVMPDDSFEGEPNKNYLRPV